MLKICVHLLAVRQDGLAVETVIMRWDSERESVSSKATDSEDPDWAQGRNPSNRATASIVPLHALPCAPFSVLDVPFRLAYLGDRRL